MTAYAHENLSSSSSQIVHKFRTITNFFTTLL